MNTNIELDEETEMPCPCQKCGTWFDLNDGYGSDKWFPNTVICKKCHKEEEKEIERDEEIQELKNELDDAVSAINNCRKRLKEYDIDVPLPELNLPMSWVITLKTSGILLQ